MTAAGACVHLRACAGLLLDVEVKVVVRAIAPGLVGGGLRLALPRRVAADPSVRDPVLERDAAGGLIADALALLHCFAVVELDVVPVDAPLRVVVVFGVDSQCGSRRGRHHGCGGAVFARDLVTKLNRRGNLALVHTSNLGVGWVPADRPAVTRRGSRTERHLAHVIKRAAVVAAAVPGT